MSRGNLWGRHPSKQSQSFSAFRATASMSRQHHRCHRRAKQLCTEATMFRRQPSCPSLGSASLHPPVAGPRCGLGALPLKPLQTACASLSLLAARVTQTVRRHPPPARPTRNRIGCTSHAVASQHSSRKRNRRELSQSHRLSSFDPEFKREGVRCMQGPTKKLLTTGGSRVRGPPPMTIASASSFAVQFSSGRPLLRCLF